jgi:hypothetical protein
MNALPAVLPQFDALNLLQELLISALGALVAFYLWNWYHSPFLIASGVEQKEVISREENRDSKFNTRLHIKNIGRVPARNCVASLWLKGRNSDVTNDVDGRSEHLYVISSPIGWVNRRGTFFANDHRSFSETETIAPDDTGTVELFRQTHTGQFSNADWISDGISTAEIYTDEISTETEERLGEDTLIAEGRGKGDLYAGISGGIDKDELETTQWPEAEIRIVAENSNIVQRKLDVWYEDGQVKASLCRQEESWRRFQIGVRKLLP